MKITEHDDGNRYEVRSDSGNTYTVTFQGRGDGDAILWRCDCPAGQHGRECKHLRAVAAFADEQAAELGYE